jgi:hypothetical protein
MVAKILGNSLLAEYQDMNFSGAWDHIYIVVRARKETG